ncbi:MAG: hypothetical protein H7257_02485, partial [Taibaiella sp.]|nr:hypothetical protein [Taibaiella sp.]
MKIRINGNSVRLRLSKTEVASFCSDGYLEEKTEFGTAAFTYKLQRNDYSATMDAGFEDGTMTMYIPTQLM